MRRDRRGVADVGLRGDGPAAGFLDLAGQRFGIGCAACVIDDDGETIGGERARRWPRQCRGKRR